MNADEIIEHVKNADNLHLTGDAYWRSVILSTLDAIREPSDEIMKAGYREDSLRRRYVAMIDAFKREVAG